MSAARIVVGALPSLARNLLMPTFACLLEAKAGYVIDIVEMTPREAIEQLNGRMIDMALISGYAARDAPFRRIAACRADGGRAISCSARARLPT